MRRNDTARWLLAPVAAMLLALAACGGGDDENAILPTMASFTVTTPLIDPVVYLQKNAGDTTDTDNVVVVDVMLRHGAGVTFSAFTLEMSFTPGVVQVGQIDASTTPLGECGGSGPCPLICHDNLSPSDVDPANSTGTLLIGVGAQGCGTAATVTGTERLLTISFIGASVGESLLDLVDDPAPVITALGDCEILDAAGDRLPIPCVDGGAKITVAR